ncbi:FAD-binding oxidoreductase [Acidithiobacillus concretivorus]|uniref:2Fe-2S iron-sulfur cluster binding domain-containing protein n=1 Tax=Acidithiobacillus concretivorus TaxID=3063952 RepID=A0ABS5ZNL9_9PROT|nr:FAD-binding oxidoreductase [Acidithiobacillus concretivorus]MBU2738232.1 2Fe-2S iron-sulfur cluster binding domain-containing protein [Acidithiobacillus concretivorus]
MEYEICLEPSGICFKADASQNIVEAAKAHNVAIKHGCASGSCGDCKGTILSGESEQGPFMPLLLLPTERAAGMAILCKLYPRSNMRLQAEVISRNIWKTEIVGLSKLAWNVLELRLRPETPYPYRTGQYARMAVPGHKDQWRSYSMATPPQDQGELVFHVRELPGGLFSRWLFYQAQCGDSITLGPAQGEFALHHENHRPMLCIAAGTGLAPIEAIIQESMQSGQTRPIHLFYGAKKQRDFYHLETLQQWARQYAHLRVTPTISDAEDAQWKGARRLLPTVAANGHWQDHEVYLCGGPGMIEAAIDLLLSHGVSHNQIHFDAFAPNG